MKNKRGWIRIVEAFVAILLITGAILIVINQGYFEGGDRDAEIYDTQIAILREIELNDGLRSGVLGVAEEDLQMKWNDVNFPQEVKDKITDVTPNYLNCVANICGLTNICSMESYVEGDVYVRSVAITANLSDYSPRQVKLFCWFK